MTAEWSIPLTHEDDETYHGRSRSGKVMSSHLLKEFERCPYQYHRIISGVAEQKDTAAFALGRAVHCLALEGQEAFNQRFAMDYPINEKTGQPCGGATKAYKAWKEIRQSEGKDTIAPADSALLVTMAHSIQSHPLAQGLLSCGVPEAVVFGEIEGVPCQIKIDWWAEGNELHNGIVDLKTCDDLTFFMHDAKRYGYMNQFAFYRSVVESASDRKMPVYAIAVEKKEPYRTGVFSIPKTQLELAEQQNATTLQWFKECRDGDFWPTGYEHMHELAI